MIYLAGKISDSTPEKEAINKMVFYDTETWLSELGVEVYNPIRYEPREQSWERYLAEDLQVLYSDKITGICMLKGWRDSAGARLEYEAAICRRKDDPSFKIIEQ